MRRLASLIRVACSGLANASPDWQALPEQAPHPADNPPSVAKIELGKQLFFDPRFSAASTISCNS